jgi:NAD(P)H dehydrogenase (quinone)
MTTVAIVYHSGYGHTEVVAKEVAAGAEGAGATVKLLKIEGLTQDMAPLLEQASSADAIIFGSPTYMGDVSAPLKAFFEASSKIWYGQGWKDKVAGGFTNSFNVGGNKDQTLSSIIVLAMQHSMVWVGTGLMPSNPTPSQDAGADKINRMSYMLGLATQSDNASAEVTPPAGDRETARLYGARVAAMAGKLRA